MTWAEHIVEFIEQENKRYLLRSIPTKLITSKALEITEDYLDKNISQN